MHTDFFKKMKRLMNNKEELEPYVSKLAKNIFYMDNTVKFSILSFLSEVPYHGAKVIKLRMGLDAPYYKTFFAYLDKTMDNYTDKEIDTYSYTLCCYVITEVVSLYDTLKRLSESKKTIDLICSELISDIILYTMEYFKITDKKIIMYLSNQLPEFMQNVYDTLDQLVQDTDHIDINDLFKFYTVDIQVLPYSSLMYFDDILVEILTLDYTDKE